MAEPFGILGLIIPLLTTTVKITKLIVDRSQQVPSQIESLHDLLEDMEERFRRYESATASHGTISLPENLKNALSRHLKSCGILLDEYHKVMTKKSLSAPLERFMWPINNGGKLDSYHLQINQLYTTRLIPALLDLIRDGQNSTPPGGATPAPVAIISPPPVIPSPPPPSPPSALLPQTGVPQNVHPTAQNTRPVSNSASTTAPLVELSGECVGFDRTALLLGESVAEHHRFLNFNEVQVVSRDCQVISLQFMCIGASRLIEHTLPEGTFPFINDERPLEVRFLGEHTITITDESGLCVYQINQPRYKFPNIKNRNKFRSLVYGRELLGPPFQADKVTSFRGNDKECIAKSQFVQLWRFSTWKESIVTFTFLATPDPERNPSGPRFYNAEIGVDQYESKAIIENRTVKLRSRLREGTGVCIRFREHQDAQRFKRLYNEHRNNRRAPQLEPLSQTTTLTDEAGWFEIGGNALAAAQIAS
ncbi:hypothetical protein QBC44DRAFT_384056 [Cladorrhinum sp. PSN332]|nr:hypothetical protein QBC44DRAFT_384056 [Cladorrhinum sp. PSN332]